MPRALGRGQFVIGERQDRLMHLVHQATQNVGHTCRLATGPKQKYALIARRIVKGIDIMGQVPPTLERRVEGGVVATP